jgi:hypothetical protein
MISTFTLEPYVGATPVRFGMTASEVKQVLGPPSQVSSNYLGEQEESRDGVKIRYSKEDQTVVELSFLPTVNLIFDSKNLFQQTDPIRIIVGFDPDPYEWVGFVIFLALGVTITGYHDSDLAQRSITVFSRGRWDAYRTQFAKFSISNSPSANLQG